MVRSPLNVLGLFRRSRYAAAVLLLAFLFTFPAAAFTSRPHLIHSYTAEDGLPSSGVYSLDQGPDGRIWFVTRSEVTVFDGFSWQNWSAGADLPAWRLKEVQVDRSGTVTLLMPGSNDLLARLEGEAWTTIRSPDGTHRTRSATVFAVLERNDGEPVTALGTLDAGLWLHQSGRWHPVGPEQGLPGRHVRGLIADGDRFLVATEGGLGAVDADGAVDLTLNRLIPPGDRNLLAVAVDGPAILLLTDSRLVRLAGDRYHVQCDGLRLGMSREFPARILPVPGGGIYFGTHLQLWHQDEGRAEPELVGLRQGLLNDGATDLCLDREGNVWVAGLRGVSKLVPTPFRSLRQVDGLFQDEVTAVCEPEPGRLVFGHTHGLTFLEGTVFRTIPFEPDFTLPPGRWRVLDVTADGRGGCWIAGSGLGLIHCIEGERLEWYRLDAGEPQPVTSVLMTADGDMLAATEEGVFRKEGERFEPVNWSGGTVPPVRRMFTATDGSVYLATIKDGLWQAREGHLTALPGLEGEDQRRVSSLLENPDGTFWVGTWAGLFLLRDGRLERPQRPMDRMRDIIFFITRDTEGNLWFGTNDGVVRWDGRAFRRYGVAEGLAGRETNRAAGFVDSSGRFWVGTETGLSRFIGDDPFADIEPPLVGLTGLFAGDQTFGLDEPVQVKHDQNTLVFEYRAVSFTDETAVRYRYFLEGFDEGWLDEVPASTRRARYTNLPAGRYRFHVRAANAAGHWSEPVAGQWITVLKPFWLHWWFFLLVGALVFQVGFWAFAAVSRKRYARRLGEEVTRRTAELEESREHYRLLFHGAAVPKLIIDIEDGVVIDANPAAEELCRLPAEGFPGRRPEETGPAFLAEMIELGRNAEVGEDELQVTGTLGDGEGHQRDVEAWGARLTLGGRRCVLVTAMDVTGRRQLEVEQLRTSKLDSLGVLAGGIAHDFNNLLTAIMGNLSLVQEDLAPESEPAALVESAVSASRNARRLTSQLLTFARGGAPVRRTADLGKLVREAATLIMSGSSCACDFSLPDDLWPAEVDEGQITQLVNNLVINACQAMPHGGRITIRARNVESGSGEPPLDGPHLRISVADEGEGIPGDALGKVFDPYFSTREKGSGLGLATAYAIVRGHGGAINVQSSPGKGALFRVCLPATPDAVVPDRSAKRPLSPGPGRVLVMDDEQQILEFYERALTRLGYQPVTAINGETAVHLFEESVKAGTPFDAVIMDLTIPGGMGGREAVRLLQRIDPEVKVVVASGYSRDPVLADPEAYGFSAVLPKPFSLRAVADVLNALISEPPPGESPG